MRSEIICVGSEILLGEILNTNAKWLAEKLSDLGIAHYYQSVVGDNLERLKGVILTALSRSDVIFLTGGLGPTEDDLTHEALASTLGLPLEENSIALDLLEKRFKALGRTLGKANLTQVLLPKNCHVLENEVGTACGVMCETSFEGKRKILFTFPGVPTEFKKMFSDRAHPILEEKKIAGAPISKKEVLLWGIPESRVSEKIEGLIKKGSDCFYAVYASKNGIRIRVSSNKANSDAVLIGAVSDLKKIFEDHVISSDGKSLEQSLFETFRQEGMTFSSAESCTGGGIGELITSLAGSSEVFEGGVVSYSNSVKKNILGVSGKTLESFGAVSKETAREMSEGVLKLIGSDYSVSVTGVAGPGGGSKEKPVGYICFSLSSEKKESYSFCVNFGNHERHTIRHLSKMTALFALLLYVKKSPLLEKIYKDRL